MNVSGVASDSKDEKSLAEVTLQTVPQNLTTIQTVQSVQNVQNIQNVVPTSNVQNIQTVPVTGPGTIVGKSVSLDLNSKILMKSTVPSNIVSSIDSSKLANTVSSTAQAVRLIPPTVINAGDRQTQSHIQQGRASTVQISTSVSSTSIPVYHVPRGPAAVANISTPRTGSTIVRVGSGEQLLLRTVSRFPNPTTANQTQPQKPVQGMIVTTPSQWQPRTPSIVYQPQRHPVPVVTRPARPTTPAGYTPRLVTPVQACRPGQRIVVTSNASNLIAPLLQNNSNNNNSNVATRIPTATNRPPLIQVTTTQASQTGRPIAQIVQPNQTTRTLTTSGVNRISIPASVIGNPSRIPGTLQALPAKKLTIGTTTTAGAAPNRIVIPQHNAQSQQQSQLSQQQPQQQPQQQQQQQQQQSQPTAPILQTVTPIANFTLSQEVSRVISTTTNPTNVNKVSQAGPANVARITSMSLHSLPLTPARVTPIPLKVAQNQNIQNVQLKQTVQQQTTLPPSTGINSNSNIASTSTTSQLIQNQNQNQFLHTYYSVDNSNTYSQYRQTTVQPVRLLVEPGYEEPIAKPNSSPRPSILRKREHENSPGKGIAKNLAPVLAALPASSLISSPPGSPKEDRDGSGNHSSGSTTVSATSSPGPDDEPDHSLITINTVAEMSPRKKPRKQQLTGVELSESRCTEEEMEFITEEKIKKEIKDEKDKFMERKLISSSQNQENKQTDNIKKKPAPSLLATSWKCKWTGRQNHYRRPSDVRPREERRPTVNEIAQQKHVLQKVNGWKVYHLTAQMEDLAELEKQVHDKLKSTLMMLESQQNRQSRPDEGLERANELIKGNMQRSILISEGMSEARTQLIAIFQHKSHVAEMLQRSSNNNKRIQKKRDK